MWMHDLHMSCKPPTRRRGEFKKVTILIFFCLIPPTYF
jgi:hypothetical protein